MFEKVTNEQHTRPPKDASKITYNLLRQYVQLRTYNHLVNSKQLSEKQRKIVKSKHSQRRVLREIHARLKVKEYNSEDTYEIWHDEDDDNVVQDEYLSKVEKSLLAGLDDDEDKKTGEEESGDDTSDNDESDTDDDEGDVNLVQKSRDIVNAASHSNWVKAHVAIQARGFEVLPVYSVSKSLAAFQLTNSLPRQHIETVYKLLHISILRKNWDIAYDAFCVLVRSTYLDVRSIWPLGIEILANRDKLRPMAIFKEERFFDWLLAFHTGTKVRHKRVHTSRRNYGMAPMWRSGSKSHSAMFVITSLWSLMFHKKISKLTERLDEMLLSPPFNVDGALYFIKALCNIAQIHRLVTKSKKIGTILDIDEEEKEEHEDAAYALDSLMLNSKSAIMNLINEKHKEVLTSLKSCEGYGFEYPKDLVHTQLEELVGAAHISDIPEAEQEEERQDTDEGNSDTEFVTAGSITWNDDAANEEPDTRNDRGSDHDADEHTDRQIEPDQSDLDFDFDF